MRTYYAKDTAADEIREFQGKTSRQRWINESPRTRYTVGFQEISKSGYRESQEAPARDFRAEWTQRAALRNRLSVAALLSLYDVRECECGGAGCQGFELVRHGRAA
jgi:hypothetical protein